MMNDPGAARRRLTSLGPAVVAGDLRAGDLADLLLDPFTGTIRVVAHRTPLLDLTTATWTCNACGDTRPDACISVTHWLLRGLEDMFPGARCNYRYCNDRPACTTTALAGGVWPAPKEGEVSA